MYVKTSIREPLVCLVAFVGKLLVCVLPITHCFLNVCIPTNFAALFQLFLSLTTSAFSRAAKSVKSTPIYSAAGTINSRKNVIAALPTALQLYRILFNIVDQNLYSMESPLVLRQRYCIVFFCKNWTINAFLKIKTGWVIPTDTKDIFFNSCLSSLFEDYEKIRKKLLSGGFYCRALKEW